MMFCHNLTRTSMIIYVTHSKSGEYLKRPNRPNQGSQYERKNSESVLTHFWCRPHTRTYEISIRFLGCCNLSSEHDFKLTINSILSDQ